jgi:hypothetical protein
MQFRMASTTLVAAALAASVACSKGETSTADTTAVGAGAAGTAATPAGTVTDSGVTTGTGTGVGAASANNLNDPSTVTQLDAIISAAEGGLTSLSGAAAIAAIDPIREKLHNSGQPTLESIADDLDDLKDKLDDDKINGREVCTILNRIGPKVTPASQAPGAPAQLARLATLLPSAGKTLGGAATR